MPTGDLQRHGELPHSPEAAVEHDATDDAFEKHENEELHWNFASLSKR